MTWLELAIAFLLSRGDKSDAQGTPVLQKGPSGRLWQVRPIGANQRIETAASAPVLTFTERGGQRFLVARAPGSSGADFDAAILDFKIREQTQGVGAALLSWTLRLFHFKASAPLDVPLLTLPSFSTTPPFRPILIRTDPDGSEWWLDWTR